MTRLVKQALLFYYYTYTSYLPAYCLLLAARSPLRMCFYFILMADVVYVILLVTVVCLWR